MGPKPSDHPMPFLLESACVHTRIHTYIHKPMISGKTPAFNQLSHKATQDDPAYISSDCLNWIAFCRVAFISGVPAAPISSSPSLTTLTYMGVQPARPSQHPSPHFRNFLLRHHSGHHFMQHILGFLSTIKIMEPSPFGSEIDQSPVAPPFIITQSHSPTMPSFAMAPARSLVFQRCKLRKRWAGQIQRDNNSHTDFKSIHLNLEWT